MSIEHIKVGQMQVNDTVMVTDPCYNDDVWCRLKVEDMQPGTYDCMVDYDHFRDSGSPFVASIRLILSGGEEAEFLKRQLKGKHPWRLRGAIGVDAGIAGFFNGDKPNFDTDEWFALCDWMREQDKQHKDANENGEYYIREVGDKGVTGFWSRTAYGDGEYNVFAINGSNGKTVALAICYTS